MENQGEPRVAFLSIEQAAHYTGLSQSMLNKPRVYGGGATFRKVGRRVTYAVGDGLTLKSLAAWEGRVASGVALMVATAVAVLAVVGNQ